MKKFLVLFMATHETFERMMSEMSPEEQKKGMEAWESWMKEYEAQIVDQGGALGKTTRVEANGTKDVKNEIGGYSVVQADSREDAAKIFGKDHPHFMTPGTWIEIIEEVPMTDMQSQNA